MHAVSVSGEGDVVWQNDFEAKITQDVAHDIVGRLNKAVIIAKMADDLDKQGLTERAFQSLLKIEPLIHEASIY